MVPVGFVIVPKSRNLAGQCSYLFLWALPFPSDLAADLPSAVAHPAGRRQFRPKIRGINFYATHSAAAAARPLLEREYRATPRSAGGSGGCDGQKSDPDPPLTVSSFFLDISFSTTMMTKAERVSEEVRETRERGTMGDTHGGGSGETPSPEEGGDGSLTLTYGHASASESHFERQTWTHSGQFLHDKEGHHRP